MTLFCVVASTTTAAAAPFSDGSFEQPAIAPIFLQFDVGGPGIGPWTVVNKNVEILKQPPFPASDGVQSIDMIGNQGPGGGLQQVFDTVAGADYRVSYDAAGRCGGNVRASVNGVLSDSVSFAGASAYQTRSFSFTAAGSSTTLLFDTTLEPAPFCGAVLDNVTVTATAPPTPFTCSPPTIFLSQGGPTTLFTANYGAGTTTRTPVGGASAFVYNAIGFDPLNNLIYGLASNGHLLRIDQTGAATDIAATGLPGLAAGGFDGSGNYYVTGAATSNIYKVDTTTGAVTTIALHDSTGASVSSDLSDIAYIAPYFWGTGATANDFVRIDPVSGLVETFPLGGAIPNGTAVGADWVYGNGNLGLNDNTSGTTYQVKITNGNTASPTFSLVSSATGPPALSSNDGTACIGQPANLSITKAAPAAVLPGGTITWTLTVHNSGPGASSGYTVTDPLPAGVTGLATSSPGCAIAAGVLTCVEGPLAVNADAPPITVTGTAPATTGMSITNTANVTGNEANPNPSPSGTSMTAVQSADLELMKTAAPNPAIAGQTVTYMLTTTNHGPDTAVNAKVVDTLPPGVTLVNEGDEIEGNTIWGALDCKNNTPPPVDDGAPNSVRGARLGQCANLGPSAPPAPGTQCTQVMQTVTCPLGDIPNGGVVVRKLTVVSVAGSPMNTATASSDTLDPNLVNNTATTTTTVNSSCTANLTGLVTSAIIVPSGTFLCLNNALVLGSIVVHPGAAITSMNSIIQGGVSTDGAVFVTFCSNEFRAAAGVSIQGTQLAARVGDEATGCAPNTLAGGLMATGNLGGLEIADNTIKGAVSVQGNTHT